MNRRAQLDDINPMYVLLSIIAGLIGWFVAGRASTDNALPIITGILSVVVAYIYLSMTD